MVIADVLGEQAHKLAAAIGADKALGQVRACLLSLPPVVSSHYRSVPSMHADRTVSWEAHRRSGSGAFTNALQTCAHRWTAMWSGPLLLPCTVVRRAPTTPLDSHRACAP